MKKAFRRFAVVALAVFLVVTFMFTFTASAVNCEEWYTRRGMVDKAGDNEKGYTIGSRGDTSFTVCRYGEQLDIMQTEIQFSFKAWPTDPRLTESWAYITFGTDFKENSFMTTSENNREYGRIQIIMYQRLNGTFHLRLYNDYERAVITKENFDFDAIHTISFEEKALGIFLVFDGMPYTEVDFSTLLEKHIGENAGKTYFAVGGYEGYEYTNLRILPKEKKEVEPVSYDAPNNSSGKLGDDYEEPAEDVVEETKVKPVVVVLCSVGGALLVGCAVLTTVIIVKKKKSKKKL